MLKVVWPGIRSCNSRLFRAEGFQGGGSSIVAAATAIAIASTRGGSIDADVESRSALAVPATAAPPPRYICALPFSLSLFSSSSLSLSLSLSLSPPLYPSVSRISYSNSVFLLSSSPVAILSFAFSLRINFPTVGRAFYF